MLRNSQRKLILACFFCLSLVLATGAQAQREAVVRAVLFYSPTCPHCHQVINEVLVPMVEQYGDGLQILAVDVSQAGGQELYQAAVTHFQIPEERLGVPTLIVGDTVLVGSIEIPAQFPTIFVDTIAVGVEWPAIPGLAESINSSTELAEPEPEPTATPAAMVTPEAERESDLASGEPPQSTGDQPQTVAPADEAAPLVLDSGQIEMSLEDSQEPPADPLGFALALAILFAMLIACAYVAWRLIVPGASERNVDRIATAPDLSWAIPLIAVLGIGIAAYLAYVEVAQVTAVCGPVGHCNLVQSSPYARILGIPIAIFGIVSYMAIIVLWFIERLIRQGTQKAAARISLIGLTVFGTLFSIYLTLLELFVIRAVCAWCLSSAVFMTLLMVMVVRPATKEPTLALR